MMYGAGYVGCGANLCRNEGGVLGAKVHGRAEHIIRTIDAVRRLQMVLNGLRPVGRYWIRPGRIFGLNT